MIFGKSAMVDTHRDSGHRRGSGQKIASRSQRRDTVIASTVDDKSVEWNEACWLPWKHHPVLHQWVRENLVGRSGDRRPKGALLLVGPRFSGKTRWAQQFGEYLHCTGVHCPAALDGRRGTYVVCDDVKEGYPYAKEVLSSQMVVTMHRDDGVARQRTWGLPCIWTCDQWDDPRRWGPDMAAFVDEVCTVFEMREHGFDSMFLVEKEERSSGRKSVADGGTLSLPKLVERSAEAAKMDRKQAKEERQERGARKEETEAKRKKEEEETPDFLV